MLHVLKNSWPLFLGILLLMMGNGLQGSLLGVRGGIEGFSTGEMSVVMAAYFLGFLGGSRMAPELIRRVGHVRVFAALASLISAVLILYPVLSDPVSWTLGRIVIGFCFSGVYVTAESWLNNSATNETRGQALSLYMIVQMAGVVAGQGLLAMGDPAGYVLFIIPSVLVSVSFAPILLSVSPTPAFDTAKPLSLKALYAISPLGVVGMLILGGLFAAQFGMAAVYATEAGMTLAEISMFVASMSIGALVLQFPIGWLSDRMDRRMLILLIALFGALAGIAAFAAERAGGANGNFALILAAGFLIGGMTSPLYALLLAYTNDFLEVDDMAAASGGLVFVNGLGAIAGPIIVGWLMAAFGPPGYFIFITALMLSLAGYALWRMSRRPAPSVEETSPYTPVLPSASPVAVEVAQELAQEMAGESEDPDEGEGGPGKTAENSERGG